MASQKRSKTKYAGVYFNETTKKYDIKYNYKVYNPLTQKNDYKAKWVYNLLTITEARTELAKLQAGGVKPEDKDITLQGAFDLWKIKMQANNSSPVTIRNTEQHLRMISQFIPLETRLKDITEETYLKFCSDIRSHGYADETLYSLNASFRKLINLAHKKRLIKENILDYADNMKTKQKEDYRLIEYEEFELLDTYFKNNNFVRLGVNNYPKYRLLINLLYFTGMRIGEVLALTYNDFETFSYYKKTDDKPIRLVPSSDDIHNEHLQGTRVKVTKAYVSEIKLTKDPKNFKKRTIPLPPAAERLAMRAIESQKQVGGSLDDRIFNWGHGAASTMIKNACKKVNIPTCGCHDFRHTYISNLIKNGVPLPVIEKVSGDTQGTILKRYSHMFESDEVMVLMAMSNL
ncbi:MAG: site-specific integrase [Blautia sp.]|nr:site-specific integrase [Blautia sp.]